MTERNERCMKETVDYNLWKRLCPATWNKSQLEHYRVQSEPWHFCQKAKWILSTFLLCHKQTIFYSIIFKKLPCIRSVSAQTLKKAQTYFVLHSDYWSRLTFLTAAVSKHFWNLNVFQETLSWQMNVYWWTLQRFDRRYLSLYLKLRSSHYFIWGAVHYEAQSFYVSQLTSRVSSDTKLNLSKMSSIVLM